MYKIINIRLIKIVILLILLAVVCLPAYSCAVQNSALYDMWGFKLSADIEEVFYNDNAGFAGDGARYRVLELFEPLEIENHSIYNNMITEKNLDFENAFDLELQSNVLNSGQDSFEIDDKFMPNWNDDYAFLHCGRTLVYDHEQGDWKAVDEVLYNNPYDSNARYWDNVYFVYFPNELELIIFENYI